MKKKHLYRTNVENCSSNQAKQRSHSTNSANKEAIRSHSKAKCQSSWQTFCSNKTHVHCHMHAHIPYMNKSRTHMHMYIVHVYVVNTRIQCAYMHIFKITQLYASLCTVHKSTHTSIYKLAYKHSYTHKFTCICIIACIYIYIYIHTQPFACICAYLSACMLMPFSTIYRV